MKKRFLKILIFALTLALAAGASPEEAATIANQAAGVVVGYVGTRAIEASELLAALAEKK